MGRNLYVAEEFNERILSPDLSDPELRRLHAEVLHIYRTFCRDDSADKIRFDPAVVEGIRSGEHNRCKVLQNQNLIGSGSVEPCRTLMMRTDYQLDQLLD